MGRLDDEDEDLEVEDEEDFSPAQVIALPTYSEIPEPSIPLGDQARKGYDEWCRNLMKINALTNQTREHVESLALANDEIITAKLKGRSIRAALEMRRSALLKLERINGSQTIEGPGRGESPYAAFGFAKRARQRRHPEN